jgi:hypothetical protein
VASSLTAWAATSSPRSPGPGASRAGGVRRGGGEGGQISIRIEGGFQRDRVDGLPEHHAQDVRIELAELTVFLALSEKSPDVVAAATFPIDRQLASTRQRTPHVCGLQRGQGIRAMRVSTMLHVNLKMLARLDELETDLLDRRIRVEAENWTGEIEGIDVT